MTACSDVAIIGGGPAGTAAALTLAKRSDLSVTVLERGAYTTPKVGESLSPGVRSLLHYLDLWPRFEAEQMLDLFGTEAAWGSQTLGSMDFILTLHGAGWSLDRQAFERMMAEEAARRGTDLRTGCHVRACRYDGTAWTLDLGGSVLRANFVIDAAGRTSPFSLAHGAVRQRNDTLTALTARLPRLQSMPHMTRVEAFRDGWWYAAPLPSGEVILCLFSDASRIHDLRLSDPAIWADALRNTQHIKETVDLSTDLRPDTLEVFPAFSGVITNVDPGLPMIAAGDAMAARDPLSSSGIPNAIAGGIQAARVAADHLFGKGTLKAAYLDSVMLDHNTYMKAHWKTYRTESRWSDAPFWRFRTAQVNRHPDTMIQSGGGAHSIFVSKRIATWIATQCALPQGQADVVARARAVFPDVPDERLILAVEDLTCVSP